VGSCVQVGVLEAGVAGHGVEHFAGRVVEVVGVAGKFKLIEVETRFGGVFRVFGHNKIMKAIIKPLFKFGQQLSSTINSIVYLNYVMNLPIV
jgi:hypothetical protein